MAARTAPTMQKVADSVGVSVSTVSRILNSPDFAKKETRDSVIAAATKMGYRGIRRRGLGAGAEAPVSRGAAQGQKQIVLFAPEQEFGGVNSPDWIFRDVVPTLHRVVREKGLHLLLSSYRSDDTPDLSNLTAERTCGVLWMADGFGRNQALLARIAKSAPVVVINDDCTWPPHASVIGNNRIVMFKAVEHLTQLGHRRISYFDAEPGDGKMSVHTRERISELREAIAHFGLDAPAELVIMERFGMNEHPRAVAKAMDRIKAMKTPPTAMIVPLCYAIQFIKEMRERRMRVPGDLSILAIDNAPVAELVDPALTVIDCNFSGCAEMAVELLLEQTDPARQSAKTVLVEPKLIVRASTAAPRREQ